jgi:hypothetical protein
MPSRTQEYLRRLNELDAKYDSNMARLRTLESENSSVVAKVQAIRSLPQGVIPANAYSAEEQSIIKTQPMPEVVAREHNKTTWLEGLIAGCRTLAGATQHDDADA